ncbi:uncharacterized protein LOC121304155 [Polyodon spathula]|uniref:uncharacterized protein LOC121304155 n=1 Tax=Polyodon spathula TaxID=7913 RepID=UPI001B7DD395|nr:uncharacterized protein LOC121304155 [Polyodon spathula]
MNPTQSVLLPRFPLKTRLQCPTETLQKVESVEQEMADRVIFSVLAVLLCFSGAVLGQQQPDCSHCYKIEPRVMAGIIATDVVLTVLIVVFVYYLASRQREKKEKAFMKIFSLPVVLITLAEVLSRITADVRGMERRGSSSAVLLILTGLCGSVHGQQNCKSCYQMDMGTIIGIIIGDIILTFLIALSVFCFATRINESRLEALKEDEVSRTARAKGKSDIKMKGKVSADTESPYQELQRHKQDIYSDLRQCNQ